MSRNISREYTRKILNAIQEGTLDKDIVLLACLNYMSEVEVKDMAFNNEFVQDEDEEDPIDDFNYVGSRHHY